MGQINLLFRLHRILEFKDIDLQCLSVLAHLAKHNRSRLEEVRVYHSSSAVSPVGLGYDVISTHHHGGGDQASLPGNTGN